MAESTIARTLDARLAERAAASPNRVALSVAGRDSVESLTYAELDRLASRTAARIRKAGAGERDRVVLLLPSSVAFAAAFYGSVRAGAIPVPAFSPTLFGAFGIRGEALGGILAQTDPTLILVAADDDARRLAENPGVRPYLRRVRTPAQLPPAGDGFEPGPLRSDATALIQFSSGSTGTPRGIELTHANLVDNVEAISERLGIRDGDVAAAWLPLYHDMGLIGFLVGCVVGGYPAVLMSPLEFIRRPVSWLRLLERHRATITAAPQFAYSILAHRLRDDELRDIDLRSMRKMLVGAEPLVKEDLDLFLRRLAPAGLQSDTLVPCYGLAENSLAVSMADADTARSPSLSVSRRTLGSGRLVAPDDAADAVELLSCGRPVPRTRVRIRDASGDTLPERRVGEIQVRGPSVCRGSFGEVGGDGMFDGPWLRTGDLGAMVGADLYVTGRSKELIIVRGQNYYPQHIESAAAGVDGVRAGRVVAFGVPASAGGTESLVVVAESTAPASEVGAIQRRLRGRVSAACGLSPADAVVVDKGAVTRTTSGKLQRRAVRAAYLAGELSRKEAKRREPRRARAAASGGSGSDAEAGR